MIPEEYDSRYRSEVLSWGQFLPRRHLAIPGDILVCHDILVCTSGNATVI